MSFAWSTVALLVLLLPGFLFFSGLYIPESFTRETAPRSPLGQLAGSVAVAVGIHVLLFWIIQGSCGVQWVIRWPTPALVRSPWPCIQLEHVLATLVLDSSDSATLELLAKNIAANRFAIGSYIGFSSVLGLLSGVGLGWAIRERKPFFGRLAEHGWVYDLPLPGQEGYTLAYVLSRVQHDSRILMYRGYLKAFGLRADGQFSYLLLTGARRFYMLMGWKPRTTTDRVLIGESARDQLRDPPEVSYLVIEGEDIANVVFDRIGMGYTKGGHDKLRKPLGDLLRHVVLEAEPGAYGVTGFEAETGVVGSAAGDGEENAEGSAPAKDEPPR